MGWVQDSGADGDSVGKKRMKRKRRRMLVTKLSRNRKGSCMAPPTPHLSPCMSLALTRMEESAEAMEERKKERHANPSSNKGTTVEQLLVTIIHL